MTEETDDRDRLRALAELNSTLIVEAAAGTGKTSLLAGRVVMLLAEGEDPASIAAITFTELAAGELRQRVAQYLESLLSGKVPEEMKLCLPAALGPERRDALGTAAERLHQLTCSTIHGFCNDLLSAYAVEAGIDPGAEVMDRDQADFVFGAIFEQWWRDRLDAPTRDDDPVSLIARKDPTGAEKLLREFANFRRRYRTARPRGPDLDADAAIELAECVREFRRWAVSVGTPREAETEIENLERLAAHFGALSASPGFEALWDLAHPARLPIMRKNSFDLQEYRRRSVWKRFGGAEKGDHLAARAEEHYGRCREAYGALMGRIATSLVSTFSAELDRLLAEYESFKRRAAALDFDDLLFTCRDVLRRHPQVRAAAGERFSRILVDEFQDTDPIQAEIMFLLCAKDADGAAWHERRLEPGHLFVVGDPKQAIYRFRGADLATYLLVRRAIEAQFPGNILRITANFRSRRQILDHVNRCFELPLVAQEAGYVALRGTRSDANHGLPCVSKVTVELPPNTWLDSSRDEEARVVAEICSRLIGNVEFALNDGKRRTLAPGDIALLAPVSTDLWRYERALEEAGLPFASQAGRNLFRRQEAQDLVALVRALADPRDTIALGALLRGPLVGLTEQQLLDIAAQLRGPDGVAGSGKLSLNVDPAAVPNEIAREVLNTLRDLRRRLRTTAPALLLAEAVERLRIRAIVVARSVDQAARALANVDGILERARSYSVRGFARFAEDLEIDWSSGIGSTEGLVESDGRSIEIVTVHSSKGLEWPVVIPINRASMPRRSEPFVYRRSDDSLHWALGAITPPSLEGALRAENRERRDESLRLLYVACTRAMELLIVPDFTWSDDSSWARLLDLKLADTPELDLSGVPRRPFDAPEATENTQTADVFAAQQARIQDAFQPVKWVRPSDADPEIVQIQFSPSLTEEPLQASVEVDGSRARGILLHKLMEEFLTHELAPVGDDVRARAAVLTDQLFSSLASPHGLPDPDELAATALRTLALPELQPFRDSLIAEVPIYGEVPRADALVSGRADAIALSEDGGKIVFDWKSDVSPNEQARADYRRQLSLYLQVLEAERGAVVYMTSGQVDWVTPP
ncbi:UvrD-helicase domain-containing protein [Bradyrhizobium sp. LMTR 3]|uniref:UvrD-helicase domain-containing protein n=1 Tax=Bradyrhizobium sp. LMTR 3 TaxID=189873 RepID=UPI000810C924|nr:UvrD-helicase domain-containing protein [Bradyrhizobium sp. LMTR 3]OCK59851.1 DNA helicase UvrD [Bradyrhizobium sp. LMTR 3]